MLGHKRSQEAELQVTRCMMLTAIGVAAGALLTYFIVNVIKDEGHFHKIQDGQQIHNVVFCVSITLSCTLSDSTVRLYLSLLQIQIGCSLCLKCRKKKEICQ